MRGPGDKAQTYGMWIQQRGFHAASQDTIGKTKMPCWRGEIRVIACCHYWKGLVRRRLSLDNGFIPVAHQSLRKLSPFVSGKSGSSTCMNHSQPAVRRPPRQNMSYSLPSVALNRHSLCTSLADWVLSLTDEASQAEAGSWNILSTTRHLNLPALIFHMIWPILDHLTYKNGKFTWLNLQSKLVIKSNTLSSPTKNKQQSL